MPERSTKKQKKRWSENNTINSCFIWQFTLLFTIEASVLMKIDWTSSFSAFLHRQKNYMIVSEIPFRSQKCSKQQQKKSVQNNRKENDLFRSFSSSRNFIFEFVRYLCDTLFRLPLWYFFSLLRFSLLATQTVAVCFSFIFHSNLRFFFWHHWNLCQLTELWKS